MIYQIFTTCLIFTFLSSCSPVSSSKRVSKEEVKKTLTIDQDWLFWRGPDGSGVSKQTNLPDILSLDDESLLWSHEIQGGGVPVIAGGRAYQFGYYGVGEELEEALVCFDAASGEILWERTHSDFISDIVYNRYGVGAASVDPATGNVYFQTSPGLLIGYDSDGNKLWERSLMEEFARLTFPNGRTGGPCVDGDLVIIHAITANWGKQGPARDRFYAFDKNTGDLVWSSTPGITPKDSSFSPLTFEDLPSGRRVFYSGTGCGHVVCIDARTGQPLWRFQMSYGGVNSGVVIHENSVIAVHGKENIDSSTIGRMVAIQKPKKLPSLNEEILILGKEDEVWRNNSMEAFTSTPVYKDDRVYTTIKRGELICLDAEDRNAQLNGDIARLQNKGSKEYEALAMEAQELQSQLSGIAGREMIIQNNLKSLEADNFRLNNELANTQDRERDYNRQISLLNQNNSNLIQQIESTQKMRIRLRNDIIGVIDENDQGEPRRYLP